MRRGWLWRRNSRSQALALTWRESLLLYGGVFFTFAAMGWIIAILNHPIWGVGGGLYAAWVSGISACLWAHCFIAGRLWLLPIVLAWQIFGPQRVANYLVAPTGLFEWGMQQSDRDKVVTLALMGSLFLIIGYVLSSIYMGRIAGRTMKAQAELAVARRVHEALVPEVRHEEPGLAILGRSRASTEMGGDLVDLIVGPSSIDVYLVDVSGHGVGAGIVMGMVKSAIRMRLRAKPPLATLLDDLNAVIAELVQPGMFATMACVRIDRSPSSDGSRDVEFALAGHLPILHVLADSTERGDMGVLVPPVRDLPNGHLPLGVDGDERFASGRITLQPRETLVMYTDGLSEVMNPEGRQLGIEAIRREVQRVASSGDKNGDDIVSPESFHRSLFALVDYHGPQADDQTLVVIRAN